MYTFAILAFLGFVISGIIYGKRIKQNQFMVGVIVFGVSLIGTMIVNGVIGLNHPLELVDIKKKGLKMQTANVEITSDSTLTIFPVFLDYERDLDKDGDVVGNYIDVSVKGTDKTWYGTSEGKMARVNLSWLPEGDSIPYMLIQQEKRTIKDKRWATNFGVPNGYRHYTIYLPNDSIHNLLIDKIEQNFNKDEKYQIAKLD